MVYNGTDRLYIAVQDKTVIVCSQSAPIWPRNIGILYLIKDKEQSTHQAGILNLIKKSHKVYSQYMKYGVQHFAINILQSRVLRNIYYIVCLPVWDQADWEIQRCRVSPLERGRSSPGHACVSLTTEVNLRNN